MKTLLPVLLIATLAFCPLFCDPQKQPQSSFSDHCEKHSQRDHNSKEPACCHPNVADVKKMAKHHAEFAESFALVLRVFDLSEFQGSSVRNHCYIVRPERKQILRA